MPTRRILLLAALPLLTATAAGAQPKFQPTPQDQADIRRVEAYLNSIHTLKARFMQVAPDGGISNGRAWLERPDRMRFQYDPPAPFLLVAGRQGLIFHDSQLRQTSHIPLSRTPLGILLAEKVSLSGDISVIGIQRLPGQLQVTVTRTASPGDGSLTLIFADNPLTLRQWTVTDAQRRETRVTLFEVELGGRLDAKLFEFTADPAVPGSSGG